MKAFIIVVVVLVLIAVDRVWAVCRREEHLVAKDQAVKAAWSQVDIVLQRRADLIPNLVETVKGYAQQEVTVFGDIAKARSALLSAEHAADKSLRTVNLMARSAGCWWWWKIIRS